MLFKYAKKSFNEYFFKKFILEDTLNKEKLTELLCNRGQHLFVAPAGAGKTFGIIKLIKDLLQMDGNKIYIIACPNRIQNEQNGIQYKIKVLVGGSSPGNAKIISAVYDKLDDIIELLDTDGYKDKEVVLIVDEAHTLVSSKNYRRKAIEKIKELSELSRTVIHMTATYRKLLVNYEYDTKTEYMSTSSEINNISDFFIYKSKNIKESVLQKIKMSKKKSKLPVVLINDKDMIQEYKIYFENQGLNVQTLDTDSKLGFTFNFIAEEELVPEVVLKDEYYLPYKKENFKNQKSTKAKDLLLEYNNDTKKTSKVDILLTTTVIEVGTNLKNTNLDLIYCVTNKQHFDIDSVIQFFARARKKIDSATLILPEVEQKNIRYNTFNTIKDELEETVQKDLVSVNKLSDFLMGELHFYSNDVDKYLKSFISVRNGDGSKLGRGVIYVENMDAIIDYDLLVNKAFNIFDQQFLINANHLIEILNGHVKADNFIILDSLEEKITKEELDTLKDISSINREIKNINIKDTMLKLYKFKEFELREVLYSEKDPKVFGYEFMRDLKITQSNTGINKLIKEGIKAELPLEFIFGAIVTKDTTTAAQEIFKQIEFIKFNKTYPLNYFNDKCCRNEYSILRKHIDVIVDKRKKITSQFIAKLCLDFADAKIHKKEINNFKKYSSLATKNKKSSLTSVEKKDFEKSKKRHHSFEKQISQVIKTIYTIDSNGFTTQLLTSIPDTYKKVLNDFEKLLENYEEVSNLEIQSVTIESNTIIKSDETIKKQATINNTEQMMFL